ncbi:FAD-dependent oxidoreductase [Halopseudomonas laoshanensis]|uniref:FAD-dependent oxidoreductase n=1 Tax=Halopseudomonas laoshanensis TaxID=2268758 RepID=UPI0037357E70
MSLAIAVIGSGMAGLAAAYGCQRNGHQVTVFEALDGHGMDAHALSAEGGLVDVPVRVMSRESWPSVLALAGAVGVGTYEVSTYSSCSWRDQSTWFRSGQLPGFDWPFVGSWRYLNGRALRVALGLRRLAKLTRTLEAQQSSQTLGEVLAEHPLDPVFWRGLILPILTTICTCDEEHLLAWPALQLLHQLQAIVHGSTLLRLQGGTSALAQRLAQNLTFYSGSSVAQVLSEDQLFRVCNERGEGGLFDRVIVATQANQLDFLQDQTFAEERRILGDIRFAAGELWVHQDLRFLPARSADWTALNFQMDRQMHKAMFSVLVNQVEPSLAGRAPVLQTWNPLFEPDPHKVLARIPFERAVVHKGTAKVHEHLRQWHAAPGRKVFYCGSWAHEGVPLLESAVRSAESVVDAIGGVHSSAI